MWRRFKENKLALIALFLLIIITFFVVFGPAISGYAFEEVDKTAKNETPSTTHWFGTDKLGRDLLARVWVGGRVSMTIGLFGALITSVLCCLYVSIPAYCRGLVLCEVGRGW